MRLKVDLCTGLHWSGLKQCTSMIVKAYQTSHCTVHNSNLDYHVRTLQAKTNHRSSHLSTHLASKHYHVHNGTLKDQNLQKYSKWTTKYNYFRRILISWNICSSNCITLHCIYLFYLQIAVENMLKLHPHVHRNIIDVNYPCNLKLCK